MRRVRPVVLLLVVLASSAGCSASDVTAPTAAADGGGTTGRLDIHVQVGRCPDAPATPDPGCSAVPAPPTEVNVIDAGGSVLTRERSSRSGDLSLEVPAGSYTVAAADHDEYLLTPSQTVTVSAGETVDVVLAYGGFAER